jgi:hypothetical protein
MSDEKELSRSIVSSAILEAIKLRVASVSVSALVADDTDCYAKGSPGDAYAKNKCSIDLTGSERVNPPFLNEIFGAPAQKIGR